MPRVTIAIPVYNKGKYLEPTIASALAQTYADIEFLILDNCSTDDSWSIVESFTDPRIRKIRWPENIGRAANFNSAFELAEGEFVKILDADDLLKPECIAAQVRAFDEAPPEAVMGVVRHDFVSSKGRTLLRSKGVHGLDGYYSGREAADISLRAAGNIFGTESSSLMRTVAARKVTWRETDMESDLYLRLFALGGLVVVAQSLIQVRLNGDSHSSKNAAGYGRGYQRSVAELLGSGAFPDLAPLTARERLKTSFHVTAYRMLQWVGIRI
ncbi:MAG: glycosyltransferase family 2 protein [Acidimicrobiales bacterium]